MNINQLNTDDKLWLKSLSEHLDISSEECFNLLVEINPYTEQSHSKIDENGYFLEIAFNGNIFQKITDLDFSLLKRIEGVWFHNSNINKIQFGINNTNFYIFSVTSPVKEIVGLDFLTNLKILYLDNSKIKSLNLTNNSNLERLGLYNSSIEDLILPHPNSIDALFISGCKNINTIDLTDSKIKLIDTDSDLEIQSKLKLPSWEVDVY